MRSWANLNLNSSKFKRVITGFITSSAVLLASFNTASAAQSMESLLAQEMATKLIGEKAAQDLIKAVGGISIGPKTCAKALSKKKALSLDDLDGIASCKDLSISLKIPKTKSTLHFFASTKDDSKIPVAHMGIVLGSKILNAKELIDAMPQLKKTLGGMKFSSAFAILSSDEATIDLENLPGALQGLMEDHQNSAEVEDAFPGTEEDAGTVTLQPGVNYFAEMKGPSKTSAMGKISEAILPGSTEGNNAWMIKGAFGGDLLAALMEQAAKVAEKDLPDYEGRTDMSLEVTLPEFTPFPFNLLNKKEAFHVHNLETTYSFAVTSTKEGKDNLKALSISVSSFDKYWLLKQEFPIVRSGEFEWDGESISGTLTGSYDIAESDNPLPKGLGLRVSKILATGSFEVEKGEKEKDDKGSLTVGTAVELEISNETLTSSFNMNLAVANKKVTLKDINLMLSGSGDGGVFSLDKIAALSRVPFVNEFVLDEGTIGIIPKKSGAPDFYVVGGATWTRTGLGGKTAIMKKGKDFYLISRRNGFSFAKLLPKDKKFDAARATLTVLSVPEAMIIVTTAKKDGDLKTDDMPEALQDMFDRFVSASAGKLKVYGGGLTVSTKIELPDGGDDDLSKAFRQLGLKDFMADNPLILSGSIAGLPKAPKIAMAVSLPGFKFPKPIRNVLEAKGADLYLALEATATPEVEFGVRGLLGVRVPQLGGGKGSDLDLDGRVFLKADATGQAAVKLAGSMKGLWKEPFGIGNLAYKDVAVVGGFTFQAATSSVGVELGFGGTTIFDVVDSKGKKKKLSFDTDLLVAAGVTPIPPWITPQKLGINLAATELTPEGTIGVADALLKGVLAGPFAKVITGELKGPAKDAALLLQQKIKTMSLAEILQIDQLPLPLISLTPAQGQDKVQIYFATPGAEIPGREDSGVDGVGLKITAAGKMTMLGKTQKLGQATLALSPSGFELLAQVEPFTIANAVRVGKADNKPTIDIKATIDGEAPYFKMHGYLEASPILEDETDIELSKDRIAFILDKKIGDFFEFNLEAQTIGEDVMRAKAFVIKARLKNNTDTFVKETILPKFGLPKAVIDHLASDIPFLITAAELNGELGSFVKGKSMEISVTPKFFGDQRAPVKSVIKSFDFNKPETLLAAVPITSALLADFISYLSDKSKTTPAMNFGPLKLEPGYLGGITIGKGKKAQKAFLIKAGMKLPASNPRVKMQFDQTKMNLQFSDNVLNGLIKTDFTVTGKMVGNVPTNLKFVGKTTGDFNQWMQDQIKTAMGNNALSSGINKSIRNSDLVTVTSGSLAGDFEGYFLKGKPATLTLQVRVLGKYLGSKKAKRVRALTAKIPVYAVASPNNTKKTMQGAGRVINNIANILIADAGVEIAALVGEPVASVFKDLGQVFKGTKYTVAKNKYNKKYVRIRTMDNGHNKKKSTDKCLDNFGDTGGNLALALNDCNGEHRNQIFKVLYDKTGNSFKLQNTATSMRSTSSGQCVDIRGAGRGDPLAQATCKDNRTSILWTFAESSNTIGRLINNLTHRCLDVPSGNRAAGQGMQTWDCKSIDSTNQFFYFEEVSTSAFNKSRAKKSNIFLHGGQYMFKAQHSGLCVDTGGARGNGGHFTQYTCNKRNPNQVFSLYQKTPGWFEIKPTSTNRCMDVDGASQGQGAKIHQWDCNGLGANQRWRFVQHSDGTVSLQVAHSQKCLDVANASKANSGILLQGQCHWGSNQRFKVTRIR